jgi:murein DD-endopeptidase MepM/ murein hydrolase activator NlpD
LSLIQVKRGAFVSLGQQIGLSGNSGLNNSAEHLHFELIRNSSSVDAQRYRVEGDGFVAVSEATSTVGPALIENAQFPAVASVSGIPNGVIPFTQTPAYLIAALSPPATATSPSPVSSTQLTQISYDMGQALATPCAEVLTAYSRNNPDGNRKFASAWSELFPAGTSQPPLLSVTPSTQTPNKRKVPVEVPVFPVSDARGYEVVGTYAYGRGINLATDQQTLLQRAGSLPDYGAVEAFVDSIQFGSGSTAGVTQAISNLDADTRADIAASTFDDTLRSVLTPPAPGKAGRGENVPSSSAQGVGVFSPLNAAYGLADMQVGGMDACKCYLNQPDVLFLTGALNGELLAIEGQMGDFLDAVRGQVASVVPGWAATQDAYRGGSTAYDPRTTAQIVNGAVDQIQQAVSQVDNGLTDATRRTRT